MEEIKSKYAVLRLIQNGKIEGKREVGRKRYKGGEGELRRRYKGIYENGVPFPKELLRTMQD